MYDPRYTSTGFSTDLYTLRRDNGLLKHLAYWENVDIEGPSSNDLRAYKVKSWARPTLSWSLQCEADGYSRQLGFEVAHETLGQVNVKRYFYFK